MDPRSNSGRNTTTDDDVGHSTVVITCSCMGGGWCRVEAPWNGCGETLCKGEIVPAHQSEAAPEPSGNKPDQKLVLNLTGPITPAITTYKADGSVEVTYVAGWDPAAPPTPPPFIPTHDELILLRIMDDAGGSVGELLVESFHRAIGTPDDRLLALEQHGLVRFEDGTELVHLTDVGRAAIEAGKVRTIEDERADAAAWVGRSMDAVRRDAGGTLLRATVAVLARQIREGVHEGASAGPPADGYDPDPLAHIPPEGRAEFDSANELSDLVLRDVAYLHLERLDDHLWWMSITPPTGETLTIELEGTGPGGSSAEVAPTFTREPPT